MSDQEQTYELENALKQKREELERTNDVILRARLFNQIRALETELARLKPKEQPQKVTLEDISKKRRKFFGDKP